MKAEIDPILEIIPFDDKYAVRADIEIEKNSQKQFVMKTFMMFVLEIRSAMDEMSIKTLKNFILDTCDELIERGGIDNVGFVINKKYYTIRNPNYEGIKDLLNAHTKVEDTTDFRETLICLRNSIHAEAKKLESAKISIFMFTSNVMESKLNPVKRTYRLQMNQHMSNYERQIDRLRNTISSHCDDCYFYAVGYIRKFGNDKPEKQYGQFGWVGCGQYDNEGVDISLLYRLSLICKRKQSSFNVCDSFIKLGQKFNEVSALILYEFHQFSLMVPVRNSLKQQFSPEQIKLKELQQPKQDQEMKQKIEEVDNIDDEQLDKYLQANKQEKQMEQNLSQTTEEQEEVEYLAAPTIENNIKYVKLDLTNADETKFSTQNFTYFNKGEIDFEQIHGRGYHLFRKVDKKAELAFPTKKRQMKKLAFIYTPEYVSKNVNYHDPTSIELIKCRSQCYKEQLSNIIYKVRDDIIKYKKRYVGTYKKTKIFETYIEVNEALQFELRNRFYQIQKTVREIYQTIFNDDLIKNEKQKRNMFDLYSSIKSMIDSTHEVFMSINKKQIKNQDIGNLSSAINYDKIKSSLRRKLVKRVNSNPKMVDDVYDKVEQICSKEIVNFVDLQAKNREEKSEVGNCMYTYKNFATSLKDRDCLGVILEIQRPASAIADPGRIRIRQVSTLVSTVSEFFKVHQYLIPTDYQKSRQKAFVYLRETYKNSKSNPKSQYCPICRDICNFDIFDALINVFDEMDKGQSEQYQDLQKKRATTTFGLNKKDYVENWDYWNRVESTETFFGIMPLYICDENWKVAKQLMKPCMGWTACGEPLGYTYSQTQTIPFMALSSLIRAVQEETYKIRELEVESTKCELEKDRNGCLYEANKIKHKRQRHEQLLKHVELTCRAIMRDMSMATIEQPLDKATIDKFLNYEKPICRTVDIINNNSSFIGQIYTVIKMGLMEKPLEQKFQQFFKRLIEEELRRETDGWNEEEVEDKFINKLLNVKVEEMDKPKYIVLDSEYLDRFNKAFEGEQVLRTEFQIQRQALEMVIKQNNKFNATQQMSLIEYKRLYENRVLWLWYVRFRLYEEKDRVSIHKWKCLDLSSSYQIFTMIIQNKKQRKNWKRREAILNDDYVDPFDYYRAREYLESEFIKMRNKKEAKNIILLNQEKYGRASQVFAMSKDLKQAAGALMNIEVGREVAIFYDEVYKGCNFMQQKLKMLLHGSYEGVTLFKHGWKMSKKRMNILRRKYAYDFSKYQFMF